MVLEKNVTSEYQGSIPNHATVLGIYYWTPSSKIRNPDEKVLVLAKTSKNTVHNKTVDRTGKYNIYGVLSITPDVWRILRS